MIWIWGHSKWQIKDVLQKRWRYAFVPFVFVCVSYILCSGMWNIDIKKKKKFRPTYPIFFSMLRQSNIFFFYALLIYKYQKEKIIQTNSINYNSLLRVISQGWKRGRRRRSNKLYFCHLNQWQKPDFDTGNELVDSKSIWYNTKIILGRLKTKWFLVARPPDFLPPHEIFF